MNRYDINCPHCGKVNFNLYLEDTGGWMECDGCGEVSRVMKFRKIIRIPSIEIPCIGTKLEPLSI